uniref:Bublin coiled coil protein n=1 Tax=Amphilophus citrinellus TaxID=61819 RepID=A0A3Q0SKZ4_AMPCI
MSGPNGDPDISADDGIISDEDDFGDEEYVAINSMLDQINSYLDDLEERNDALNGKLHELMESNRQARLEFRAQLFVPSSASNEKPSVSTEVSLAKASQSFSWSLENSNKKTEVSVKF